jgi:hypothetical protein
MKIAPAWFRGGIIALTLLGPRAADSAASIATWAPLAPPVRSLVASIDRLAPPGASEADGFPGRRYGNLSAASCFDELDARAIPYEKRGRTRGVDAPVNLMGPLHGVTFAHADQKDWATSARREVIDCRLVLALDDFAALLKTRGVSQVVHYGMYRDDIPLPKRGRPLHHVAGLAIDVAELVKDDETRLEVRRDWRGRVGARTCPNGAAAEGPTPESTELRGILCEVANEKTFHQVLTPNHDAKHRDHFHLEVMRSTSWTLVQ